jgi:uncharacterized repeat protein (TIGR04138 family)
MAVINPKLLEVVAKDPRYAYEAYDFVFKAMDHAQTLPGRRAAGDDAGEAANTHVKSRELLAAIRSLALLEFGLMARVVFRMWGVTSTQDFGRIVFNLVGAELIDKTDDETLEAFRDVFDFEQALVQGYTIQMDEAR